MACFWWTRLSILKTLVLHILGTLPNPSIIFKLKKWKPVKTRAAKKTWFSHLRVAHLIRSPWRCVVSSAVFLPLQRASNKSVGRRSNHGLLHPCDKAVAFARCRNPWHTTSLMRLVNGLTNQHWRIGSERILAARHFEVSPFYHVGNPSWNGCTSPVLDWLNSSCFF